MIITKNHKKWATYLQTNSIVSGDHYYMYFILLMQVACMGTGKRSFLVGLVSYSPLVTPGNGRKNAYECTEATHQPPVVFTMIEPHISWILDNLFYDRTDFYKVKFNQTEAYDIIDENIKDID